MSYEARNYVGKKARGKDCSCEQESAGLKMTPRPRDGSPWIVPLKEARGAYVHTENGIVALCGLFSYKKLRPDQVQDNRIAYGGVVK
jgi:hypothetical protein